jgi:meso-butanediol dehydrogenase/(S,S)-butanediol dehydrogenase/diacetyl reductase
MAMAPRRNMHPEPSELPLYGNRRRVAFVTGASRGLGKAVALRLAREGLDVAVNDIESEDLKKVRKGIEQLGAKSIALVGDVSDETRVEQMINEAVKELGYLDVMVSC